MSCERNLVHQKQNSAQLDLTIKIGERTASSPFYIEVTMSTMFQWENDMEKSVDDLLNQNGTVLLFSYARPYIAYLTGNAGFNPYHLPYVNVIDTFKNN